MGCGAKGNNDWGGTHDEPSECFAHLMTPRRLAAGEMLFRQGDSKAALYTVSLGLLTLRLVHPNGVEAIVAVVRPGQILGARSFLRNECHLPSAQALTDCQICQMSRSDAVHLTKEAPLTHMALVSCCLRSLDHAQKEVLHMSALPARERLCCLLLDLLRAEVGPPHRGPASLMAPLSRPDMAAMLGIKPESLSRLLAGLRSDGYLDVSGRSIRIRDYLRFATVFEQQGLV